MQNINFHPDIQNEVQEAYDWYIDKSFDLGEEFLKELDVSFQSITEKPKT